MSPWRDRMMQHLRILSSDIGTRPIGSSSNTAAADYILDTFHNSGLKVETQPFEVPNWRDHGSYIHLNGVRLNARTNTFSPPCEIDAKIIPLCTIEELEASQELTDQIALLYGELTKESLTAKGFTIYNPEHHRKIIRLLEQKQPRAMITVSMQAGSDPLPLLNDWEFNIPSVTVSPETGLRLMHNHPTNSTSVQLTINSSREPGLTRNIIAKWDGYRKERIMLTAHYDTVFGTNGAYDNASGVSALLTLAEQIAKRRDLRTGFEFIAFSSEEYLGLGDHIYLKNNHKEDFYTVLAALNFDGIGQTLGTNNLTLMAGSNIFQRALRSLKMKYPAVQWTEPWYESNHYTFFSRGIPSIPFSCNGVANILHTKEDQMDWISADRLYEVNTLALEIIEYLQDKSIESVRVI